MMILVYLTLEKSRTVNTPGDRWQAAYDQARICGLCHEGAVEAANQTCTSEAGRAGLPDPTATIQSEDDPNPTAQE